MTKSDNVEMAVVPEDPFLRMDATCLALKEYSVTIDLLKVGIAEMIVAMAAQCLYRQPHVAASSAPPVNCSRNGDDSVAVKFPRSDPKLY